MENQFVDYETSKFLKELGFNEVCLSYYSNYNQQVNRNDSWAMGFTSKDLTEDFMECLAPTWQQVEQWLWDTYAVYLEIVTRVPYPGSGMRWKYFIIEWGTRDFPKHDSNEDSPIKARTEGIKTSVKHLFVIKKYSQLKK